MLNSLDIFLIGILGGALSSGAIFYVMFHHFKSMFHEYFYNKDIFIIQQNVRRLVVDVEVIKEQIKHINLDHYETIVEDEYK